MSALVNRSLRNPPTHGLTRDAGVETRRRLRPNALCRKGLREFPSSVVSLLDGRVIHNEAALHKRPHLRAESLGVSALLAPMG